MRTIHYALCVLVLCLVALPACAQDTAETETETETEAMSGELATDDDKILYALGLAMAQGLAPFNVTEDELALIERGLEDGALGNDPLVDLQEWGPRIQQMAQQRAQAAAQEERVAGEAFLEEQKAREGAETTESGMVFIPMEAGEGESPAPTDQVEVHYRGTLRDGTVFDSSYDRGTPARFPLNRVIPCWTEGLQKMKPGGKATLVCPPDIAYGDQGQGSIPPGATLSFEVELLSVNPAPAGGQPPAPQPQGGGGQG